MIAGAVQQYLAAHGVAPVLVARFGDYSLPAVPTYVVYSEPGADAEVSGGSYDARLQLRTRAADVIAAEEAARVAYALILAADGQTLSWVDPTGGPGRSYRLEAISAVQRPTWYPTPEPGEETSCNFRLSVTEL